MFYFFSLVKEISLKMWSRRGRHFSARDLYSFSLAVAPASACGFHVVGQDGCWSPRQEEGGGGSSSRGCPSLEGLFPEITHNTYM